MFPEEINPAGRSRQPRKAAAAPEAGREFLRKVQLQHAQGLVLPEALLPVDEPLPELSDPEVPEEPEVPVLPVPLPDPVPCLELVLSEPAVPLPPEPMLPLPPEPVLPEPMLPLLPDDPVSLPVVPVLPVPAPVEPEPEPDCANARCATPNIPTINVFRSSLLFIINFPWRDDCIHVCC